MAPQIKTGSGFHKIDPHPSKIHSNPSQLASPPAQSSMEDEAQSSHLDHGVLSDEQEGLVEQSQESTGLTQKLVEKILNKNDQVIIDDDGVKIYDELDDMNIVI